MWQEKFEFLNFPSNIRVKTAQVEENLMGERNITLQVEYCDNEPLNYSEDLRLVYNGQEYIMPTRLPQASHSNDSAQVPMELVFEHEVQYRLKQKYFVTLHEVESHTPVKDKYQASVSLNLGDFVDLLSKECELYFGGTIQVHLNPDLSYDTSPTFVQISYSKIWDVLVKLYETYNVTWKVNSHGIWIGYPLEEVNHIFEYGHEGGLTSVEREVQSDEQCNVLLGRGGSKNLPYRYYKDVDEDNPTFAADPDWIEELKDMYFDVLRGATFRSYIQGYNTYKYGRTAVNSADKAYSAQAWEQGYNDAKNGKFDPVEFVKDEESIAIYGEKWDCLENNEDYYPTIELARDSVLGDLDVVVDVEQVTQDDYKDEAQAAVTITDIDTSTMMATIEDLKPASEEVLTNGQKYYFSTKGLSNLTTDIDILKVRDVDTNKETSNLSDVRIAKSVVNVYRVSDGTQVSASGLVQGDYYFTFEITIENLDIDKHFAVTAGITTAKIQSTTAKDNFSQTFDIWIKNIWGNDRAAFKGNDEQFAHEVWDKILGDRLGNEAKVIFRSGYLAVSEDYEFTIVDTPQYDTSKIDSDGIKSYWRITLAKSDVDLDTLGVYVPCVGRQGASGDEFAFIGIDMPHQYVVKAEIALDDYKKQVVSEKAFPKETYNLNLDRIRLQEATSADDSTLLFDYLMVGNSIRLRTNAIDNKGVPSDGAYKILYIQSMVTTYRQASSEDAALNPDVEITVSDDYETTANPVATISAELSSLKQRVNSFNIEQMVRAVGDKLYLRKDGLADISQSPTKFYSLLTSGNFRAGIVGGAGWGFYKDANGKAVLEADVINVRQDLVANTLVINQVDARTGTIIESAAALKISAVTDENDNKYTVTFDQKDGSIANTFVVNDIVYCSRFYPNNTHLKSYKGIVLESAETYLVIEISGDGQPEAGDVIVQYGNIVDKNRQYVKVRDVIGGGYERYIEGLDSPSAEGVEYFFVGRREADSPRWFIGYQDGQYIEWKDGVLNIKGTLSVQSTVNGDTLPDYFTSLIPAIKQEDIEGFVNAIVGPELENIQNQIDGVIETWFIDEKPTLDNYPANEWTTDSLKTQHIGDLCYDNSTGSAYRFTKNSEDGSYYWNVITDEAITKALELAKDAKDTADKKRRIFTAKPYPPYDVGDLWVNATYPDYFDNDTVVCKTRKGSTQSFQITDWQKASKYTDDTVANQALNAIADYSYLKEALANDTTVSGGLLMTSLISLGYTDSLGRHNLGGMNGIYTNAKTIASWWGGTMIDRLLDSDNAGIANAATALIRMDGSGYFAKGYIKWEADGSGAVAGGNITWTNTGNVTLGSGVAITLGDGSNEGLSETMTSLLKFLNGFTNLITPMDADGNELPWAQADSAVALKAKKALYSVEDLSAFGNGSGSGSGGGGGASALSQLVDVELSSLASGQYLKYNGTHWVNVDLTIPTKTSQLTNDSGFLTKHQPLDDYLKTAIAESTYAKKTDVVTDVTTDETYNLKVYKNGSATTLYPKAQVLKVVDNRSVEEYPNSWTTGLWADFKNKSAVSLSGVSGTYVGVLTFKQWDDMTGGYPWQLALTNGNNLYMRQGSSDETWGDWAKLAKVTDNVASATKLEISRTLWGQSFDGTANVSGNIDVSGEVQNVSKLRFKDAFTMYGGAEWAEVGAYGGTKRARMMVGKLFAVEDMSASINTNYSLYVVGNSYLSGSVKIGDAILTWDSENQCLVCDKPIVSLGDITAFKS